MVLVMGAVRDVDRTLVTVARAYGATTWQLYWKVLLPAIVPSVVAGMRLGVVFCLLGVLVVEMFAGVRGMGYVMSSLANGFQAPELFAATALVSAASIAIVLVLDHVNERLSHWRGRAPGVAPPPRVSFPPRLTRPAGSPPHGQGVSCFDM